MPDPMPEAELTPDDPSSPAAPPPLDTSQPSPSAAASTAPTASAAPAADDPGLEQLRCPHCGSTQLDQDSNGVWHCRFCRGTFRSDDPRMIVVASPNVQRANDPVIDTADLLTGAQEQALTERFRQLDAQYGVVIVLETVNTITENVDLYARRRAQELGVGDDATDNGIYILIVDHPHHVQVEAGDGLAAKLPHEVIQQVVDGTMIPAFRAGDYVTGVGQGAAQLAAATGGVRPVISARSYSSSPSSSPSSTSSRTRSWIWIPIIVVCAIVFLVMMTRGGLSGGSGGIDFGGGSGYSDYGGSGYSDYGGGGFGGGSDFGGGDFGGGSSGGGDW